LKKKAPSKRKTSQKPTAKIADGPEERSAVMAAARAAAGARDWVTVAALLEPACRLWPGAVTFWGDRIEALVRQYRFDAAEAVAAALEQVQPDNPRALAFLAGFAARNRRWSEAEARFDALRAARPQAAQEVMRNVLYRQAVFNIHGISVGAQRLDPVTHRVAMSLPEPAAEDIPDPQAHVFVSGMPRSGTTALGQMLGLHPDIVLFVELHNYMYTYAPESFSAPVIARQQRTKPTIGTPDVMARAPRAPFLGDKRPLFHYALPHTLQAMAGRAVHVLHILRPVVQVAASYHARAVNPQDIWDPLRDIHHCIDEMNVMHRYILDLLARPPTDARHRISFVDYSRCFGDIGFATDILAGLGAAVSPSLRAVIIAFQTRSAAVMARPRQTPPAIAAALEQGLDMVSARAVVDATGIDILAGL